MSNQTLFTVCVRCFTFNHAPYIKDAMNGFCMQQTTFPFVCVIVDDASTDGEQEVIKSYLAQNFDLDKQEIVRNEETDDFSMTFAQHKTNVNCFFAVYLLKYNHYSIKKDKFPYFGEFHDNARYVALCEGDDYWIDSLKLQKQVDAIEDNPNVTCVHTGFVTVDKNGKEIIRPIYEEYMERSHNGNVISSLLNGNYVMTLTTLYRPEVFKSSIYKSCPAKYDYAMSFTAAMLGDFIYLPVKTACYRKTPGGSMDSMHSDVNHPLIKMRKEVYSYFSKLIIDKKLFSVKEKVILRCHILIHLLRIHDNETLKFILGKDIMSKLIYPFACIYKRVKYAKECRNYE